ncbi:uncharacterized protein [Henckelia pumila]|uniref:uncharacterized protein n=1 Tax=Henckelia pumila TaxID=405737 RepID=UPI003C6E3977
MGFLGFSSQIRGSFARVCVEMDVLLARSERIWVGWGDHCKTVEVVYEQIPHFCSHCRLLGHSLEFCSRNGPPVRRRRPRRQGKSSLAPQDSGTVSGDQEQTVQQDLGPPSSVVQPATTDGWTVQRGRQRYRLPQRRVLPQSLRNSFEVLRNFKEDVGQDVASGGIPAIGVSSDSDSQLAIEDESGQIEVVPFVTPLPVVSTDVQSSGFVPTDPVCLPVLDVTKDSGRKAKTSAAPAASSSHSPYLSIRTRSQKRYGSLTQQRRQRASSGRPP